MKDELTHVPQSYIDRSQTYPIYLANAHKDFVKGLSTYPGEYTPEVKHYEEMNLRRMDRLGENTQLLPELKEALANFGKKQIWLALTETWCGDAAQNLPIVHLMAEQSPNIEFKVLLRDQNPELMDRFLTNGGRAIPIVIFLEAESLKILGHWGPRPAEAQQLIVDFKAKHPDSKREMAEEVQKWYAKDKAQRIQEEFLALLT